VGDIVTAPLHRGQGIGSRLTWELCHDLLEQGHDLVVLNVAEGNMPARKAYAKIGFGDPVRHREGFDLQLRRE
jgi:predicted GNAT family acetyltransferase